MSTNGIPLDKGLDLTGKVFKCGEHAKKSGGYSDVWEGLLRDEKVAVKVLREVNPDYGKLVRVSRSV